MVEVVAEAGQTHGGSLDTALALVDAAKAAGCDAVKFQALTPELIAQPDAPLYWDEANPAIATQRDAFAANGMLDHGEWKQVADRCQSVGIEFLATPFDIGAVAELADLGVRRYKVASGDITNKPLIKAVAATGLPVILSTGAAARDEIVAAKLWWLAMKRSLDDLTLLACSLIYPCPPEHAHLSRISQLWGARRGVLSVGAIGYSDHTREVETALPAVLMGATVLEKHFALGDQPQVADTAFALRPAQMAEYVRLAHLGEAMRGEGLDHEHCEDAARQGARRSVCAARDLPEGHRVTSADLVMLRPAPAPGPAGGLEPVSADALVGRWLSRGYREGEPIKAFEVAETA